MNVTRRDMLKLGGLTLLGLASARYVPNPGQENGNFSAPLIWHGSRKHPYMAFSYDDCYLLNRMQDLEVLLGQYPDFKVTYFPIGQKLLDLEQQDTGIWKRLVAQGHEIGYHTFDHVNLAVMSPKTALDDYDKWYGALVQVLGIDYTVRFVRPPFDVISYTLDALCQERKLVAAMYSLGGGGAPDVVVPAIEQGKYGDIIQMHIRTQDYTSSTELFPALKAKGIASVTLSHLYDDLLREQDQSAGCEIDTGPTLTRTCLD